MSLTAKDVLQKKLNGDAGTYKLKNLCLVDGDGRTFIEFKCIHSGKTMGLILFKREAEKVEKRLEVDFPGG
jgi:hypothetical protein